MGWQDAPLVESGGWQSAPEVEGPSFFESPIARGLATAPINLYLGAKQYLGGLSPIEQNILAQNKEAAKAAPWSAAASNLLTSVPAFMMAPATVAGAGAVGAAYGALQPVEGEQSLGNIAAGKAKETAIGGALGAGGQYGAGKIGDFFTSRVAEGAKQKALNLPRDIELAQARQAGYKVPNSEVAPSFLGNRLESIGGKAAIRQEATLGNQEVTNAIARKAIGLPENQPITPGKISELLKKHGQAYDDVASLSPQAYKDVEAWKIANANAKAWFNRYGTSKHPDDLAKAKQFQNEAGMLESWIDWAARSSGKPDLLNKLQAARKEIAKVHTVERATSPTGEVNAQVFGRLLEKQKPLSGGLEDIGAFASTFPKFAGRGAMTQAPGIGATEAISSAGMGMAGALGTGSPSGLLAAGIPLLRHPARALALSKAMQRAPSYGPGYVEELLANSSALLPRLPMLTQGLLSE